MWVFYALFSAFMWGFNYVLSEKILEKVSILTWLILQLLFGLIVLGIYALISGNFNRDLAVIMGNSSLKWLIFWGLVTFLIADLLVLMSIQAKNATLATLIEISYPLFVILVGWLLYKENHLNLSVIIGGLLIFSGIFIIYRYNH